RRSGLLRSQIDSSFNEILEREHGSQQIATTLVELEAERNAGETRDGLLQLESDSVRARLAEIEEELRGARQLLDQARDHKGELTSAAAKLESDVQHMAETCLNELGRQREELMSDASLAIVDGEQLAMEDQVYREMRAKLDGMGPVNMM